MHSKCFCYSRRQNSQHSYPLRVYLAGAPYGKLSEYSTFYGNGGNRIAACKNLIAVALLTVVLHPHARHFSQLHSFIYNTFEDTQLYLLLALMLMLVMGYSSSRQKISTIFKPIAQTKVVQPELIPNPYRMLSLT